MRKLLFMLFRRTKNLFILFLQTTCATKTCILLQHINMPLLFCFPTAIPKQISSSQAAVRTSAAAVSLTIIAKQQLLLSPS